MKGAYEMMAYERVLKFLGIKEQFPHDMTNNANPTN
jgi:hypothetical protein